MSLTLDDDIARYGYFWVRQLPEAALGTRSRRELKGLRGYLTIDIISATPLHVGAGEVELDGTEMYERFCRLGDCPLVPGSSIKGAVRSFLEALSSSCRGVEDAKTRPCGTCPACGLFGSLGSAGWARFDDGPVEGRLSVVEIDQRTEARRTGPNQEDKFRKFYARDYSNDIRAQRNKHERIEVAVNASISTTLTFDGIEDWELGLLQLAMGMELGRQFNLKMGGAKNRGLGVVSFQLRQGIVAPSKDWMLGCGKREVTEEMRTEWAEAYWNGCGRRGLATAVEEIADYFRKEYGHQPQ